MSPQLGCTVCQKKFRSPQNLKAHNQYGACQKVKNETIILKKKKPILIKDDKNKKASPQPKEIGTIKKPCRVMLKKLDSTLFPSINKPNKMNDKEFKKVENKPIVEAGSPKPIMISRSQEQEVFKVPGPPASKKSKSAWSAPTGALAPLAGRPCHYCPLAQPDWISLALHYVSHHWEEVRRRQWGQGPRSKFHTLDSLQDARTIIPPPRQFATALRPQVRNYCPLFPSHSYCCSCSYS